MILASYLVLAAVTSYLVLASLVVSPVLSRSCSGDCTLAILFSVENRRLLLYCAWSSFEFTVRCWRRN